MTDAILAAHFVTDENRDELVRIYQSALLNPTPNLEFLVGYVVVVQTFNVPDLFNPNFGNRHQNCWLTDRAEFDVMFDIVDDGMPLVDFAIITEK